MSVLEGAFVLAHHVVAHPEISLEDGIRQLMTGPASSSSYDFDSAAAMVQEFGKSAFRRGVDGSFDFRAGLFTIVTSLRPFWARASIYGRKRVLQLLSENEKQCFAAAGLLKQKLERDELEWWDQLALTFRSESADNRLQVGRAAEQLTLDYERSRLRAEMGEGFAPTWIAPEDNTAGYDVESFSQLSTGEITRLLIEVKGFRSADRVFFITRREWEKCATTSFPYRFYVWDIEARHVVILGKQQVEPHIPLERGIGEWTSVELSLNQLGAY